jgi:hypothetical protein
LEKFVFNKEAEFSLTLLARAIDIQSQNVIAGLKKELLKSNQSNTSKRLTFRQDQHVRDELFHKS